MGGFAFNAILRGFHIKLAHAGEDGKRLTTYDWIQKEKEIKRAKAEALKNGASNEQATKTAADLGRRASVKMQSG